jgi:hypothetical protein
MTLELDFEERQLLKETLEQSLGELREEIYHCEDQAFKNGLKRTEEIFRRLLRKLAVSEEMAGVPQG